MECSTIIIRRLNQKDLQSVYKLIQNTIGISYSEAYPREAIEFFKNYHSKEQILDDTTNGYTLIAECNGEIIGTATLLGTNIRRVFVSPPHQHRGIGKLLVQELEKKALREKSTTLDLEASLVSKQFWESLGFTVHTEEYFPVRNDQKLHYYKMIKTLNDSP